MKRRTTPRTISYCEVGEHPFRYNRAVTEPQLRRICSEHAPSEGEDAA